MPGRAVGGSDPGPRWAEQAATLDEDDDADQGSFATENSDEEPLEGEPAAHVEAMLSHCLDPDERQAFDDDEDELDDEELDEDDERPAAAYDGNGGDGQADGGEDGEGGEGGGEGRGGEVDSEQEETEEAHRLALQLDVIKLGLHDFGALADECLQNAQEPPPAAPPPPVGGKAAATALSALPARVAELREMQQLLRLLALNQQALLAHCTQQLLYLAQAQAQLALRRHDECMHRHKQLRIVRRESARLCRCLDELHQQLRAGVAPQHTLLHHHQQAAAAAPFVPGYGEHGTRRTGGGAGGGRRRPGDKPPSEPRRAHAGKAAGAKGGAPPSPPRDGDDSAHSPAAPTGTTGGGGGGATGGGRVPPELAQLVSLACQRASAQLASGRVSPPLAGGGIGGATALDTPRGAARRKPPQPQPQPPPGPPLPPGLVAAYAPQPAPPRRPATAATRRTASETDGGATPRDASSRVGGGVAADRSAAAAQLRQPLVQAAMASALWQVLTEAGGKQLLGGGAWP